jgi:tRNA(Phe) wybutosine-synthesizing methylase Tyw3
MMNFVSLLIATAAVIHIASAFNIQRAAGFRTSSISANKLDGVFIKGDLSPLANNLLIKVKEAAVSTSGWQAKK